MLYNRTNIMKGTLYALKNIMNKSPLSTFIYVLITCLVFANVYVYSHIFTSTIPEPLYPVTETAPDESGLESEEQEPPKNVLPEGYEYIQAGLSDTHSGTLLLVNSTHSFVFDNVPTVIPTSENVSIYYNKTKSYSVRDINVSMNAEAVTALNRMLDDFSAFQGGKKSLIILEGLRTYEAQQQILDEKIAALGPEQTIAQTPGASEHHTGYAMDMDLYENGVIATFTGEGDYAWIYENAHKYGFVLRYQEGKESITGISPESWHFRYVGVPHAEYMYKNNLSLEEYIDALAMYPFESGHLSVTDEATGASYEIYSVAVNADGTQVPVPASPDGSVAYTLSGDNSGHVIVTVKKA